MFRPLFSVILIVYLSPEVKCNLKATKTGTSVGDLAKELALLGVYGSERAIIVRNKASDWIRVWCSSKDDSTGEQQLKPDDSMGFKFNPMVIGGHTLFWCTIDYKGFWARWDAFGGDDPWYTEDEYAKAYEYEVKNDGVYIKGKKIRGLDSGQNRYELFENYDDNPPGARLTGYVDSGMCNNLPGWMETKTSGVVVCDKQCVILYESLHCRGETSRLQAGDGCTNFFLPRFEDRARSVKGC